MGDAVTTALKAQRMQLATTQTAPPQRTRPLPRPPLRRKEIINRVASKPDIVTPTVDIDWRKKAPVGSTVKICEYETEKGWFWKPYKVKRYFPNVVMCVDQNGFVRTFGNWEFQKRQKGAVDNHPGSAGQASTRNKIDE